FRVARAGLPGARRLAGLSGRRRATGSRSRRPALRRPASARRPSPVTPEGQAYSVRTLSAHPTRLTKTSGLAKLAFLDARSDSRTPRALAQAPQTWMRMPCPTVARSVSASGGHPTGTTAFATGFRINETASPSRKTWTSWPAAANALAWRNAKAALVGSSDPHALFTRTLSCLDPDRLLAMLTSG